jgi:hypothetical protein
VGGFLLLPGGFVLVWPCGPLQEFEDISLQLFCSSSPASFQMNDVTGGAYQARPLVVMTGLITAV